LAELKGNGIFICHPFGVLLTHTDWDAIIISAFQAFLLEMIPLLMDHNPEGLILL
jgi:hypothetical protein